MHVSTFSFQVSNMRFTSLDDDRMSICQHGLPAVVMYFLARGQARLFSPAGGRTRGAGGGGGTYSGKYGGGGSGGGKSRQADGVAGAAAVDATMAVASQSSLNAQGKSPARQSSSRLKHEDIVRGSDE